MNRPPSTVRYDTVTMRSCSPARGATRLSPLRAVGVSAPTPANKPTGVLGTLRARPTPSRPSPSPTPPCTNAHLVSSDTSGPDAARTATASVVGSGQAACAPTATSQSHTRTFAPDRPTNLTSTPPAPNITINQPPAAQPRCGLDQTGICCKESDTAQSGLADHQEGSASGHDRSDAHGCAFGHLVAPIGHSVSGDSPHPGGHPELSPDRR